jgi:hypothetical protein
LVVPSSLPPRKPHRLNILDLLVHRDSHSQDGATTTETYQLSPGIASWRECVDGDRQPRASYINQEPTNAHPDRKTPTRAYMKLKEQTDYEIQKLKDTIKNLENKKKTRVEGFAKKHDKCGKQIMLTNDRLGKMKSEKVALNKGVMKLVREH